MEQVNRLGSATSPYLLQHKDNPVDWFEWGEQAFAEARRRDVPILLSVGYAACHWCHVMAHDSFEDADVAALMNEHYVNVKVDREERPDVDAVYMEATTALTGQGGWPMTCLLTPDAEPFFAGTFFPRAQFTRLLQSVAQAWREDRDEVLAAGQRIVAAISQAAPPGFGDGLMPTAADLDVAAGRLVAQFDERHGGFGKAPKFPPSMVLEFLLRHHERTCDPMSLAMAEHTLQAMARGGIYDQLAGGFSRYAVDQSWVVPHFEKMLYDNALLLRVYLHWARLTGNPLAYRIARETADFLLRDLCTTEGGFASALDADTDGVEGLTYVWTRAQLDELFGAAAAGGGGSAAAQLFEVTAGGTFEDGASTLQLLRDPEDVEQWEEIRGVLLAARTTRAQPARDDKVVTAWNGLAIASLAEAAVLLGDTRYLVAAHRCAELVVDLHVVQGRLRRTSRDGVVGDALAVAEDYGDLADGLLVLHQATADPRWLTVAGQLLDFALAHFGDGAGGFFDTADDAERLVRRPKDPTDNATPSGASALAHALLTYSALSGSYAHREAAQDALRVVSALGTTQPRFLGWALACAEGLVAGPVQIAIVGEAPPGKADPSLLTGLAWRRRPPGAVVITGRPDADGLPLLADRPLVAGAAAAYVCRGMVCGLPVTTADALSSALEG
ncbi:MAG: thioredoxin domain-containing protein [Actinomycetota bacterium]|nr:thioredoxin domain-containing protein [Actinomycetota bacterium]